jgi:hypothetical protein
MRPTLNQEKKLKALKKAWSYVDVTQATRTVSGWKVWLVKNYSGKPIGEMSGQGLPGNPKAKCKIEFSGYDLAAVLNRAHHSHCVRKKK